MKEKFRHIKCPKCKKEMEKYSSTDGIDEWDIYYQCDNPRCWFYGIRRNV